MVKMTPSKPILGQLSMELRRIITRSLNDLEAFKGNIFIAMKGELPRSLIVISSGAGDGRTVITGCLGYALSRSQKILLIDSCLEKPRLHELFNLPRSPGLTDYLNNRLSLDSVVQFTELPHVQVLTAGSPKASGSSLSTSMGRTVEQSQTKEKLKSVLSSSIGGLLADFRQQPQVATQAADISFDQRFSELILLARNSWDCVICDSSPYLGPSDAPFLARHFEGALLVINSHRTRYQIARLVVERFTAAQGRLVGVILNRRRYYIPSWFYRFL
jgi:Mrp family chromosome partitioning ATPase